MADYLYKNGLEKHSEFVTLNVSKMAKTLYTARAVILEIII